jgi:hypothetical protein
MSPRRIVLATGVEPARPDLPGLDDRDEGYEHGRDLIQAGESPP